jgi:ElaB/YqjD/DUF883 family membrane-anchored ribosome-binding protein
MSNARFHVSIYLMVIDNNDRCGKSCRYCFARWYFPKRARHQDAAAARFHSLAGTKRFAECCYDNPEETMSSQDYSRASQGSARDSASTSDWTKKTAKEALSTASSIAGQAVDTVKEAASQTAATARGEIKQLLDQQVDQGAQMLASVAKSAQRVAQDLQSDSPRAAGLVRAFAGRVDGYANDLRDQSFEDIVKTASDFTRRQPALVFGLAALAGFFALRTFKSGSSVSAPPIAPHSDIYSSTRSDFHAL